MRKINEEGRQWLVAGESDEDAAFIISEVDRNEEEGNNTYTIVLEKGYGDRNPFYTIQNGQILSSRHY
ncbi:MAG: hypothetical protein WC415_04375 [Patescibacteria group bacterium]|jgi:hypothetical protein